MSEPEKKATEITYSHDDDQDDKRQSNSSHPSLIDRITRMINAVLQAWNHSLPGRIIKRYSAHHGSLMANGLAYGLLFAFFSGLWVVISVFGIVVSGNSGLQTTLLSALNSVVPGIGKLVTKKALNSISGTLTWTGIITIITFWWSITGWMDSLRNAVQSMFEEDALEVDIVRAKVRDTAAMVIVVLLFVLSTTAGAISGGIVRTILGWLNISTNSLTGSLLIDITGFAVGLVLNFALMFLVLRIIGHIKAGRFTVIGCSLGAVSISVMQLLGTKLLTGASKNPLLAPFAAIIGVLIWFNLIVQVIMYCTTIIAECRQYDFDKFTDQTKMDLANVRDTWNAAQVQPDDGQTPSVGAGAAVDGVNEKSGNVHNDKPTHYHR